MAYSLYIKSNIESPKMDNISGATLKSAIRQKYTWPGGYEMFGVCSDGAVLCCDCMHKEYKQVAWSRKHKVDDGWRVVDVDNGSNMDESLNCEHCDRVIAGTACED